MNTMYQNHHYSEHDVIDCTRYTDELMEMVGDRITWYPINTFYE